MGECITRKDSLDKYKSEFDGVHSKSAAAPQDFDEKSAILFEAILGGDDATASNLLSETPELANVANEYEQTAFWQASCLGRTGLVKQMLSEPIASILDLQKKDRWERSPMEMAAKLLRNRKRFSLTLHYPFSLYGKLRFAQFSV